MLTTEQVKKIAEYIWDGVPHTVHEDSGEVCVETGLGTFDFDPKEDDYDSMQVFKALVDECKNRDAVIDIDRGIIEVYILNEGPVSDSLFKDDFNNESICLAYLAVMESK